MDSWATDSFYSHFPSYSQQPTRKEELARARQHEYQTFLNHVTPRKTKNDGKIHKRNISIDSQSKKKKIATTYQTPSYEVPKSNVNVTNKNSTEFVGNNHGVNRKQFVKELENMDLPDILNEDMISSRNQQLAEEKRLKSIQYQRDLMTQIEQKRRERELQKAKEQEEEERLLKKMEEQLKLVRLQDELECQRQSRQCENRLINVKINKPIINSHHMKHPTTVRSEQFEPNVYTYRSYDERKAQSERVEKENCGSIKQNNDKDIYNFFTNSAQNQNNQLKDIRYSHYFDLDDSSENEAQPNSMSSSYHTYPSKSIRLQHESRQPICSFCKQSRFLVRSQEENINNGYICGTCENEPICLNCRKEICVRCKRPTHVEEKFTKISPRQPKQQNYGRELSFPKVTTEPQSKPVRVNPDLFRPIHIDDDESLSDSTDHKPYSFNIDQSSVFHPSKARLNRRLSVSVRNGEVFVQPDSFDELKRITEEKLSKLSKNYGPIRTKKSIDTQEELNTPDLPSSVDSHSKETLDSKPILRENTKKLIELAKELEQSDQNIFRHVEPMNKNSASYEKQIFQNSDTNTSTLTQVGAIRKHIQLDKLNF